MKTTNRTAAVPSLARYLLFLFLLLSPRPALAQLFSQTQGTPRFGTFGGGPDVINLANLNNHLAVPVFQKPGRALNFEFSLTYDSSFWLAPPFSGSSAWSPARNWGWGTGGTDIGTFTDVVSGPTNCLVSGRVVGTKTFWSNFVYYDGSGTPHPFYGSVEGDTSGCPSGGGTDSLTELAQDGSGYTLVLTGDCCRPRIDKILIISPGGANISPSKSIQDTNGNLISTDGLGHLTDTLGLVALTTSGSSPSPVSYTYTDSTGHPAVVQVTYKAYTVQTNFGCSGISEYGPTANSLVDRISLPNGTFYQFAYELTPGSTTNVTGRLASVTLPTGGAISYVYTGGNHGIECTDGSTAGFTRTTPDGTWTYSRTLGSGIQSTTTTTDPLGNQTVMQFLGIYQTVSQVYQGPAATGTLLQTNSTCYDGLTTNCTTTSFGTPISQLSRTIQLGSAGPIAKHVNFYDGGPGTLNTGVLTEQDDYDYGSGGPGPLVKKTLYGYGCTSSNGRIVSAIVQNGSGIQISKVTYNYDETTPVATSGLPQHAAVFAPRCNLTSQSQWLNTTGGQLTSHTTYFDTGMLNTATDPNGHTTTYSYSSTFAGAYPTTVNNTLNQSTSTNFDSNTGLIISSTDPNGKTTTLAYDNMLRSSQATRPDGGQDTYSRQETTFPFSVTLTTKINSSQNLVKTDVFDSLGRVFQTQLNSDPDCLSGDKTDTTYNALGRVHTVSNPYCSTNDPTYGLTTYGYDALGRTTQVTHPDNSTILTAYTGRATQVQDEGNGTSRITRISQVDSLGRLVSVCEVTSASQLGSGGTPTACSQDISGTGFLTTYGYDALDNLTSVFQNGLNSRTFQYDSLSRLTSASNPESGTIAYKYDSDTSCASPNSFTGLLVSRTDARSIRTCMQYDALNRITQKNYSDSTPTAFFAYEQTSSWGVTLTNTVGRLTEQWTGTSCCATVGAEIFSYDQMGRPLLNEQFTPAMGYAPVNYTYDLAGNVTSFTNGGGETFSYTVNGAARLTMLTSSLVDSNHPGTLLSAAHYNAAGSVLSASLGNVITETRTYDPRLRLASIADGSNYSLAIPSSGGYAPNGDVLAANDSVNGNWTHSYDDFNRLSGSNQNSGQSVYSYVYDRFGNRWQQNGARSMQLSFSGANNRMDGYPYDAAGNVLSDGSHQYFYDAESRLIQVDGTLGTCSTATACYGYDASGRRVQKTTSSGTASYIYDLAGHEVVQYGPTCSPCRDEIYAGGRHLATYNNSTTYFIHPDWLGTERARSNVSGGLCETITSLPFGDGQATSGACSDASPMHFTGKERDSESGLDNFEARYDSSNLGRFMSPDPYNAGAFLDGPQTWNAYSYVLNNPLNAVDPNGLDCVYTGDAEGNPNAGRVTIIHGDCINAGGKDDGGVFVDNDENHPVQNSDVILSSDGSVGLVSYTRTDGLTTGYACLGNCSFDSVQVTAASPDQPTVTIGPQTNWFFTRQAGCVLPGLKGFMGGLILKKDIDAALSPILGPPPGGYEGTGMGTASVAAEEGLKHVAENRPFLNTVKAALKEEGHRVSANALARGATFLSRAAVVTHVAFAANDGREDYNACMQ